MTEMRWLSRREVDAIQLEQLAEHGGAVGVLDDGGVTGCLAAIEQKYHYEKPAPTTPEFAGLYLYPLAKCHGYRDGNKRVALVCAGTFLLLNGWQLDCSEEEAELMTLAIAAGDATEAEACAWMTEHSVIRPAS